MPLGTPLIRQSLWQDPLPKPILCPLPIGVGRDENRLMLPSMPNIHWSSFPRRSMHLHTIAALFVLPSESEQLLRILACLTGDLGKSFATAV
jgi:hypothetical protein